MILYRLLSVTGGQFKYPIEFDVSIKSLNFVLIKGLDFPENLKNAIWF